MVAATLKREPALVYLTLLSVVGALVIAFAPLSTTESAAVTVIVGAVGTIITAALARPVNVALIGGAAGTVLGALVAFGLHLSTNQIAAVTAALGLGLGLVLRQHLTPVEQPPAV